jgi:hypothetical protein
MKRNNQTSGAAVENGTSKERDDNRANGNSSSEHAPDDLSVILSALQTMRNGDFSVRLPGSWTGLEGKIADTFNSIVAANQQAHAFPGIAGSVGRYGGIG